jgi:CheY-like chemotaxis protein
VKSDKLSMETVEFPLGALVQAIRNEVSSSAHEAGIQVHCLVDASLPDRVIGDAARMRDVLKDLLLAAIKTTGARQIRLAVYPARERQPELEITFEITPVQGQAAASCEGNGGFDVPDMEPALAPFKKTLEWLGGDLGVHPQRGAAPVVWCRVPVQHVLNPLHDARQDMTQRPSSSAVVGEGRFPVKILMAEDNSINQRVGKLILQRAGYKIDLVGDGNEALEAHRNTPYDLILMDCQMPTMDGFEATRQIRSISSRQPIIIAVTANALVGERERCLEAGMDDYLSKPFQAQQLVSIVEKWAEAVLRR